MKPEKLAKLTADQKIDRFELLAATYESALLDLIQHGFDATEVSSGFLAIAYKFLHRMHGNDVAIAEVERVVATVAQQIDPEQN